MPEYLALIASGVRADTFVEYMKQYAGVVKWRVVDKISLQFTTEPTAMGGTVSTGALP